MRVYFCITIEHILILEYEVTTHQLSKGLSIKILPHPKITISGFTLKWPRFEVNNVMYTGNRGKKRENECIIHNGICLYFLLKAKRILSITHVLSIRLFFLFISYT